MATCLENSIDRGACRATVQRVAESQTQLSDYAGTYESLLQAELHNCPLNFPSITFGIISVATSNSMIRLSYTRQLTTK